LYRQQHPQASCQRPQQGLWHCGHTTVTCSKATSATVVLFCRRNTRSHGLQVYAARLITFKRPQYLETQLAHDF
jgi:hypothetical protein